MTTYLRNRSCACPRCRIRGLMGAAILVTLGVLFLLDNYGIFYFDNTWPVLLIVIGLLSFAAHNAPTEGHIQRYSLAPSQNPGQETVPGQSRPGPEVKS